MIKPVWALAGAAALGIAGATGALIVVAGSGEEEVVQQAETATPIRRGAKDPNFQPTTTPDSIATTAPTPQADCVSEPAPGDKLFTWGEILIQLPLDESVLAFGRFGSDYSETTLTVHHRDTGSDRYIDATTGAIREQSYIDEVTRANVPIVHFPNPEIDAVLATVSVCRFDPKAAAWPYTGEPPPSTRKSFGRLLYIEPHPASGLLTLFAGECANGCRDALVLQGNRSEMWIDAETGEAWARRHVADEDREAFDRFLASIQVDTSTVRPSASPVKISNSR